MFEDESNVIQKSYSQIKEDSHEHSNSNILEIGMKPPFKMNDINNLRKNIEMQGKKGQTRYSNKKESFKLFNHFQIEGS